MVQHRNPKQVIEPSAMASAKDVIVPNLNASTLTMTTILGANDNALDSTHAMPYNNAPESPQRSSNAVHYDVVMVRQHHHHEGRYYYAHPATAG